MPINPLIPLMGRSPTFSLLDFGAMFEQGQRLRAGSLDLREQERAQQESAAIRQAYAQQYGGGGAPAGLAGAAPTGPPAGLAGAQPFAPVQERRLGGSPTAMAAYPMEDRSAGMPLSGPVSQTMEDRSAGMPLSGPVSQTMEDRSSGQPLSGPVSQTMGLAGVQPMTPADTKGQRAFINKLYTISPKAGRDAETHAYTTQKQQLEQHIERVDYLGRVADGVLESDNPQAAWEVARAMLLEQGMPPGQVPEVVDLNYVRQLSGMGHDAGDKLRLAQARLASAQAQRERGKAPDYGLGEGLNTTVYEMFGAQISPGGRPTPTQVQQARAEYYRTDPEQRYRTQRARREEYEADATRGVREEMTGSGRRMSEQEMTGRPRRMSAADVADAMAQTGRSRAEVVAAARENGLTVEDAPDTGTAPSAAAAAPSAAAAAPSAAPSTAPSAVPSTAPSAVPSTAPSAVPSTAPRAAQAAPAVPRRSPAATATAPGEGATTGTAPGEGATTAPASPSGDMTRLRRLEALRDTQEEQVARVKRKWGTSEAGKTAVSQAEAELSRRNTEIARLHDRIYERGPEKQQRALALAEAQPLAEERGRRTAREQMSLQEFYKGQEEALRFVDTTSGAPISPASNFLTTEQRQGAGEAKLLSKEEYDQYRNIRTALPIVKKIQQYYDKIYGDGGVFAGLTARDWGRLSTMTWKETAERYPVLAAADKYIRTNAEALARGLRGMRGPATEGDVARMLDAFGDLRSGLEFAAWPPKLAYHTPSSRAVALRAMDDQVDTLNDITGILLDNPAFEHPGLHRYFRPEQQETAPSAVQRPSSGTPQPTQPRQSPGTGPRRLPSTYDVWRGQQP